MSRNSVRNSVFVALVIIAGLLTLPLFASAQSPMTVNVTLNPQNNSGESGSAVLTDMGGGKTRVQITINGGPATAQPVHIHQGTCANLNPTPKYPLNSVVDGLSDTTINASLSSLMTGGFAINGHKSAAEVNVYVFCGDIPAMAPAAGATTEATAMATTAPAAVATTAPSAAASATPGALPATGAEQFPLGFAVIVLGLLALGSGLLVRRLAR